MNGSTGSIGNLLRSPSEANATLSGVGVTKAPFIYSSISKIIDLAKMIFYIIWPPRNGYKSGGHPMTSIDIAFTPSCTASQYTLHFVTLMQVQLNVTFFMSETLYPSAILLIISWHHIWRLSIYDIDKIRLGPLTRYVKLQVDHAPEIPEMFFPPQTSKETASLWSWHTSRHVCHARAVMRVGIAHPWWRGKRSRHSRHMCNL